jgi:acyl-CoA thioesterase-1
MLSSGFGCNRYFRGEYMLRLIVCHERWTVILFTMLTFLIIIPLMISCSKDGSDLRAGFESGRYRKIVAFGDSIVEGYRQPEGWPEILGKELAVRYGQIEMINAGVSGDTAGEGLQRLQRDVMAREPDMVLIAFGLNDMKNGVSPAMFSSEINRIVAGVSEAGAQPVLLTTTRLQRGLTVLTRLDPEPYNDSIRTVAQERGIPIIDVYDEFKGLNTPKYLMDAAHPNWEGYKALAAIIRKGLIGE